VEISISYQLLGSASRLPLKWPLAEHPDTLLETDDAAA
jgi:hypothetical protein